MASRDATQVMADAHAEAGGGPVLKRGGGWGGPAGNTLFIRVRHDPLMPEATVGLRPPAEQMSADARTPRIAWTIRQTVRTE